MTNSRTRRTVILLATCQALGMSATSLTIVVGALVGASLAEDRAFATLPLTVQFVAMMLTTLPAAALMKAVGRRPALMFGASLGMVAGLVGTLALYRADFVLYCAAGAFFGSFAAFVQQYRFAAAEAAGLEYRDRAISYVLIGGVAAAFIGPQLGIWTRDLLAPITFAGAYAAIAGLSVIIVCVLIFIEVPPPAPARPEGGGRTTLQMIRQPRFAVAVIAGMFGYGCMTLVMTSTPLAIVACSLPFEAAAIVIQWHVLGMYLPSFFTGRLIERFGVLRVMAVGAALELACVAVNLTGVTIYQFTGALILLGLGWNFLFVGATSLLTRSYYPEERARAQGLNDFAVFSTVAFASLSSGFLHETYGWEAVNLGVVPAMAFVLAAILWLAVRPAAATDEGGPQPVARS